MSAVSSDGHSFHVVLGIAMMSQTVRGIIEIENSALFDLLIAANYLDIKELLIVCCRAVAMMFREKSPEDIRKLFEIINDLTPEEELVINGEP
ncbi:hypothetical protein PRIPAC_96963 [Pristionchus pacificus]|uniref:Skp1 domain-containing protein n=1 Tax=Pristionchus pacificus TaxID=54126 RepID=A0A2A6BIM9_PRIPA|nr:hypothetical protein PRIPAC_96963 [Pristionchus pacificus]|eukprot:PDM65749.1 hypothetical protein PRIPAC_45150 [Pristionchus pacificus]